MKIGSEKLGDSRVAEVVSFCETVRSAHNKFTNLMVH